jgi:hypothetical protein
MEQQTPKIEAGRVFLPKDAPWLHEFKVEVLAFPNGKHDDQIDSLSQFLSWIGNWQRRRRELIRPQTVDRPQGPLRRPAILVRNKPGSE